MKQPRGFACLTCGAELATPDETEEHAERCHRAPARKNCRCPTCIGSATAVDAGRRAGERDVS
jgi:hypothetical protein